MVARFQGGERGKEGGEGGVVTTDNRKGSLVKGQFCLVTSYTCDRVVQNLSHMYVSTKKNWEI